VDGGGGSGGGMRGAAGAGAGRERNDTCSGRFFDSGFSERLCSLGGRRGPRGGNRSSILIGPYKDRVIILFNFE
jgi:hypothetical protein